MLSKSSKGVYRLICIRRRIDRSNFDGQEKCFQRFNLPEPVLCVGGYMQIQLLGRVQRQEMDDLFYIWFVLIFSLFG